MEPTTWQTDQMPDRHRDPSVTVRPSQQSKDAAEAALAEHGWKLREALLAAVSWILANPAAALAQLAPFRPAPKPTGRPKKPPGQPT